MPLGKKSPTLTGAVFVLTLQALELLQQNVLVYGGCTSGGIYIQSDPIGLRSGINFFSYSHNNPVILLDANGLSPGGWAPIGAPPAGDVNTIYCKDGRIELYILPIGSGSKCPAIERCLRVHEDTHRKDAIGFNPKICDGLNNVAVGYYAEDGKSIKNSDFAKQAEVKALSNQISCLKGALGDEGCDAWCKNWIETEIRQRENEKAKVLAGTYWG